MGAHEPNIALPSVRLSNQNHKNPSSALGSTYHTHQHLATKLGDLSNSSQSRYASYTARHHISLTTIRRP